MTESGLTTGAAFLVGCAGRYFSDIYQGLAISYGAAIDKGLAWSPALSFHINKHKMILVEVSETPYPMILKLRRLDITKLDIPISVFCVCPEAAYLEQQAAAKELIADGFGLLTVDSTGDVQRRADCIPLIQQIATSEFGSVIKELPKGIRLRVAETFERYKHDPPSGTADIAEVLESMVLRAGMDSVKKGWLLAGDAKPGSPARTLAAMQKSSHFSNAAGPIGAVQGYINLYRNTAHHTPKDKKQAAKKYRDCRHGFLDGIKKVPVFRDAMKGLGLSGLLFSV